MEIIQILNNMGVLTDRFFYFWVNYSFKNQRLRLIKKKKFIILKGLIMKDHIFILIFWDKSLKLG